MSKAPVFMEFKKGEVNKAIRTYYEDMMLGGGSVLSPKYFGESKDPIDTPLGTEWKMYNDRLVEAYSNNDKTVGGYYIIRNVQLQDAQTLNQFVDVWLLTADLTAESSKFLSSLNNTKTLKCCWNKGPKENAIKDHITGLARIIIYTKTASLNANQDITQIWDGQVKQGTNSGFGRLINGLNAESFIGHLYNDKPFYKGLYYKDFKPKYMGIYKDTLAYNAEPLKYKFKNFDQEQIKAENLDGGDATKVDDSKTEEAKTPPTKKELAASQVLSFISMMLTPPDFPVYNQNHKLTIIAKTYYSDKMLGGGSILEEKYIGSPEWKLDTSLKQKVKDAKSAFETNAESSKESDGYFVI